MKKLLAAAILATSATVLSGCMSGPMRLTRTWDDYVNQKYTESSWIHGALLQDILPVYPIVGFVMSLGDVIVMNPIQFWGKDAWDGKGTGYDHKNPEGAERTVTGYTGESLME
jgi:hypothetical protein